MRFVFCAIRRVAWAVAGVAIAAAGGAAAEDSWGANQRSLDQALQRGEDMQRSDCAYRGGVYDNGQCLFDDGSGAATGEDPFAKLLGEAIQQHLDNGFGDTGGSAPSGPPPLPKVTPVRGAKGWRGLTTPDLVVQGAARSVSGDAWPYRYVVSSVNGADFTGTIEWTSLGSVFKVDGRREGDSLWFREVAVIVPGDAYMGCTYTFRGRIAEEFAGDYTCDNGDTGWVSAQR